jgi:hypothetical protein
VEDAAAEPTSEHRTARPNDHLIALILFSRQESDRALDWRGNQPKR